MLTIAQLRSKLRDIRKRLATNIGYLDFKYLHTMKRPQLEDLLKKYEKFETQVVGTIQNAVRNRRARNEANQLLNSRDERQNVRDLENRLLAVSRPLSASINNVSSSAKNKRNTINQLYDTPLTPFSTFSLFNVPSPIITEQMSKQGKRPATALPAVQYRKKLEQKILETRQRPLTALPPVQYRKKVNEKPLTFISSTTNVPLSFLQNEPRPESAKRSFNKFKPL